MQLTSFTAITLTEVRIELPGELFIPSALQFTPSHHGDLSNPMIREPSKDNSIMCSLSSCTVEFATNPSVMDMNMTTTPINIVIPCVENTSLSTPNQNLLTLDPIHIHLKQLYDCVCVFLLRRNNAYAFYPIITYYRKCDADIGQLNGSLSAQSLNHAINQLDNWLFSFDAAMNADRVQSQFVRVDSPG